MSPVTKMYSKIFMVLAVLGGQTTAPEYLSVHGFENCLGTKQVGSATLKCMPPTPGPTCDQAAWQELQTKFTGEKCPVSQGLFLLKLR